MYMIYIKHNPLIFLCILLSMIGCNKENKKIIVENKVRLETKQNFDKTSSINSYSEDKKIEKNSAPKDLVVVENLNKNNNVIFEFRSEKLLQGRNFPKDLDSKQTEKALSAVLKMFKKNLSSKNPELNIKQNDNVSSFSGYFFETDEISSYQNILVFLPLTGKYSNFGNNIRKAIDLSMLKLNDNGKKIIYFDTGNKVDLKVVTNLFEDLKCYL